ncbi:MAG: transglycosylase SLT domain-containing protein [Gemmatimonadota bacterium]|nr:transglycosylase SLT domain-containing protein [Gemmatimonadota bacterium]
MKRTWSPILGVGALVALTATLVLASYPRAEAASAAPVERAFAQEAFPLPAGLEPAVEFWKNVYATWSNDEVVFHDRDDLSIVYEKIWQKKSETREEYRENDAAQERIVEKYRRILLDLAARNPDPRTLSGDYEDVYEAFGDKGNPARWRRAAENIRVQRGLKERFLRGLLHAGQYRDHILRVLEEEGVPREIAWLPMVESTFTIHARSKVGAAGAWQFMPSTGKLYMRVDDTVDERFDPILAARGAARLLKRNYEGLGTWPLALTAYNHGYYGMRRAVRELGTTDYMTIRRHYDGPLFGFASKNFYAEFLAALHVAENAERYFGRLSPFRALEFDVIALPTSMPLADVARAIQVNPNQLWQLNPSLSDDVWKGRRVVPAGFRLRVPPGYGREAPMQLAAAASASGRRTRPMNASGDRARFYTVQRGDTLLSIAARHGVTVSELVSMNDIRNRNHIKVGQRLKVR